MPVDMAIRICLASSPPLHSFLSNHDNRRYSPPVASPCCQPLRPCLAAGCCSSVAVRTNASAEPGTDHKKRKGRSQHKSVAFADSQGLALTTVYVFSEDNDPLAELQFDLMMRDIDDGRHQADSRDSAEPDLGLVLGFTPPAEDYLDLRNRLKSQQVCLDTCYLHEQVLSGTIQVQNICFEKSVLVRITFDSWTSFRDVGCRYLNNVYGCADTDTFAFSISLPRDLDLSKRVEFCIQYQTQNQSYWDNNLGNNYSLMVPHPKVQNTENSCGLEIQRTRSRDGQNQMELDPLGSPRTSTGFFPQWQSWGHVENSAPYW